MNSMENKVEKAIKVTDWSNYVPGKSNNGGCYIYYTMFIPENGMYRVLAWDSSDFSEDEEWTITEERFRELLSQYESDNNCTIEEVWR